MPVSGILEGPPISIDGPFRLDILMSGRYSLSDSFGPQQRGVMFNLIVKITHADEAFLERVRAAMEEYFGEDQRRIDHALQVSLYARELLSYIDADPVQTLSAAYLHDIGIPEAERVHGSSAGNFQELEGPPVAEGILAKLKTEDALADAIVKIVGNHHTPGAIDSSEFRIIWDADALVNFAGVLPGKSQAQIESVLKGHMVTEPGYRMACNIFLKDTESHKQCLTGHRPAILPWPFVMPKQMRRGLYTMPIT
jgi:hypothetical protein